MSANLTATIVRKAFGANGHDVEVLSELELTVPPSRIIGVFGPSGCGKSTLIRILAGLDSDYVGEVRLGGERITAPTRRIGLTVQSHASYDWLTVGDNIAFGLRYSPESRSGWRGRMLGHVDPALATRECRRVADLVGLSEADLLKYPDQISGGMRQRMTFARALLVAPDILLLDEPFSALDVESREGLQETVLRVREQVGTAVVLVSHDPDEVLYLADDVFVLSSAPARVVHKFSPSLPCRGTPDYRYTPEFQAAKRELRTWLN